MQAWWVDPESRFWPKVDVRGPDDCWEWTGEHSRYGYGVLRIGRVLGRLVGKSEKSVVAAHRLAWELTNGPIPDGMNVCHHCDNPPCCNAAHLFAGTQKDNIDDMHAKGRWRGNPRRGAEHWTRSRPERVARGDRSPYRLHAERYPCGENQWASKLTAVQVRDIRRKHAGGRTQVSLADEYGITQATIWAIVHRRTWAAV